MTREDINRINSQYLNDCENTGEMEEIFALAIQALEKEPKTGHWINTANPRMSDNIVCSECGYDSIADFKFCPNCGSYNGGASNGNE